MFIATAVVMAALASGTGPGFCNVEYRVERTDSKAVLLSGKLPIELSRSQEIVKQLGADKIEFEFTPRPSDSNDVTIDVRLSEHDAAGQFLSQKFTVRVKRGEDAVVALNWDQGGRLVTFKVR